MANIELKSTIKPIKAIDWDHKLIISKLIFDQDLFDSHKARIDKVFAKAPAEVKEQQLQNILLRDTLFNHAMAVIASSFEFNVLNEDAKPFYNALVTNFPKNPELDIKDYENRMEEIAIKLVEKQLIFSYLCQEHHIGVTREETMKVLDDYYKTTNMPIRDILNSEEKLRTAEMSLLEEKITSFIIDRFPKDLNPLFENIKKQNELDKKSEPKTN